MSSRKQRPPSHPGRAESNRPLPARPQPSRPELARAEREEYLTMAEVCARLNVSRSTFYFWRQTGKAPRCIVLPNKEIRVRVTDLDAWLETCTEAY